MIPDALAPASRRRRSRSSVAAWGLTVDYPLDTFLTFAGFFLIFFFCTESFQQGLVRLNSSLQQRPRLKYVVYPLSALLGLGAAVLILKTLVKFAATLFSYE